MRLFIVATKEGTHISTKTQDQDDDFVYSLIKGMYNDGDTVGLQLNDESKHYRLTKMCNKISEAIMEYFEEE